MRNVLLTCLVAVFILGPSVRSASAYATPDLDGLKLVTQLPPELPQRITGFAYDGEKLWAAIYHGHGLYATLDPSTLKWTISKEEKARKAISDLSGVFYSPGTG
jgi:hypothetical protein